MSIANEISRLQTAKANIKTAIEAKGVAVDSAATLDTYSTYAGNINTGLDFASLGYDASNIAKAKALVQEYIDYGGTLTGQTAFTNITQLRYAPKIDTSGITDMSYMFSGCRELIYVPLYDTSSVTDMSYMFSNCRKMTCVPSFDMQQAANIDCMFNYCPSLQSIGRMTNCGNITSCSALTGSYELTTLTDVGGFYGIKASMTDTWTYTPNLTEQSLLNIIDGLYDFTGNGETPGEGQGTLSLGTNYSKLTADQIAVGTAKGWTITA